MPDAARPLVYVDDNPEDRLIFRRTIERDVMHPVIYLSNGEELFARLAQQIILNPAVILVDLVLPGMSGYEVIRELRHEHKYLDRSPLLVVTGARDREAEDTALDCGADAVIPKPMTIYSLFAALRETGDYKVAFFDCRPQT